MKIVGLPLEDPNDRYSSVVHSKNVFTTQSDGYSIQVSLMPLNDLTTGESHHKRNTNFLVFHCIVIEISVNDSNGPVTNLAPFMNAVIHAGTIVT